MSDQGSIRSALEDTRTRLASAGIDNPSLEADWLLGAVLHLSRPDLYLRADARLDVDQRTHLNRLTARREQREPLQYLLGDTEFFGLRFALTPDVLIPRPETEVLVEHTLAVLPEDRTVRVLDVGTGSGAIAVALAAHRPSARVTGIDLSHPALAVARSNARSHGVNIGWTRADLKDQPFPTDSFDVVVSNPPYISAADLPGLDPEVRCFEPPMALLAGPDGLDAYTALAPEAHRILRPRGHLFLELPGIRTEQVIGLFDGRFEALACLKDLTGRPRVLRARKPS